MKGDTFLLFIDIIWGLNLLNRTVRVMRRSINGIDFQRTASRIDDIVPRSGGNKYSVASANLPTGTKTVFVRACKRQPVSAFYPDELVGVTMHLKPNIAADRNTHQGQLQVRSRPKRSTVILILHLSLFNVYRIRLGTEVKTITVTFAQDTTSFHISLYERRKNR